MRNKMTEKKDKFGRAARQQDLGVAARLGQADLLVQDADLCSCRGGAGDIP